MNLTMVLRGNGRGGNSSSGLYAPSVLRSMDFQGFQRCVWLWLGASGYQHMRFCGRRTQRGRGASSPDFIVRIGKDGMDVAVQIRHWKSPISKRAVDEFRGVLLRDNIPAGMIVATSSCSRAAKLASSDFNGRPIRIIGVERLCESLEEIGIELNDKFFRLVDRFSLGDARAERRKTRLRKTAPRSGADFGTPKASNWLLMVLVIAIGAAIVWCVAQ